MQCPTCDAENLARAKFCDSCGTALGGACPACGHLNRAGARFCLECGGALAAGGSGGSSTVSSSAAPAAYTPAHLAEKMLASRATVEGERKQVTVLFADVVGSTELIHGADPEDAQRLLDGVVRLMMDAVHRYEGTVSRLMGDGLMALFGAPIAHEDHAVRACYAALAMQDAGRRHAEQLRRAHGVAPTIRVGLNSGEVVVRAIRDDLHLDYTAMGQTVHLAARMEQVAKPDTIALSAEALRLVEGYVEVRSLGPVPVKGLARPIEVFELLGAGAARTRLQAAAARGLTTFVGRQAEVEALHAALERAGAGYQAHALRLLGEIAARRDPQETEEAETRYREALALAEELGMRPLQAHLHLGLGKLHRRMVRMDEARGALSTAVDMLRAMEMTFWLPEAEAELALATA